MGTVGEMETGGLEEGTVGGMKVGIARRGGGGGLEARTAGGRHCGGGWR